MKNIKIKETTVYQKNSIPELIVELDDKDCILFTSKSFEDTLGYTQKYLLGKNIKDIIHPQDLKLSQDEKIPTEKNPYSHISSFRHKNGNSLYFEWKINSYTDADGNRKSVLILNPIPDFEKKRLVISSESQAKKYNIFAVTDPNGKIIYANNAFCAISNFTSEELIGEDHRIVNSGYHSREFFKEMYRNIQNGNTWKGEIRNRSKDGRIYWLETILVPVTDRDGRIIHYLGIRTDITEKKQKQEMEANFLEDKNRNLEKRILELQEKAKNKREANQLLTTILDNSFESIVFIDTNKKIQFFNQIASTRSLELFGKSLQIGSSIYDLTLPEDKKNFDRHFYSALQGKRIFVDKSVPVNNTSYWFELQYAPVKNENDEIFGVLFIARDINEKKQAEAELKKSENRFHAVFDQAPLGIALAESPTGEFVQINPKFCEILGYNEEEIIGKRFLDVTHSEDVKLSLEQWQILLEGKKKPISFEKRYIAKDGNTVWTNIRLVPLLETGTESNYHLLILLDITESKTASETLKKYMLELENLNKTKDKFFGIIAHDLRNPFGGILGITAILDSKMKEEQMNESMTLYRKYIQIVHTAAQSAYRLLENLLQWARAQTGEISVRQKNLSLIDLVNLTIPLVSGNAFKKNITIEKDLVGNEIVYADESLVATILRNLLTNAIKFTPNNGKVILSTVRKENFLEISISDTGSGMDTNDLGNIFRIDSHFSQPGTENEIGSGLGLILCKEFAEKNGGEIWVKSQPGIGSTFTFSLPLAPWQGE